MWIRIGRVPLNVWSKECFLEIIAEVRELVLIQEETKALSRMDFARVLVRTTSLKMINKVDNS